MKERWRRFWLRFALRQLDCQLDYKEIDKRAFEDWAYRSFDDKGWRSYVAYEDLKILKSLGTGPDSRQTDVFIGRRLQLLYLFEEMKKSLENRKSRQEKADAEKQKDNNQP